MKIHFHNKKKLSAKDNGKYMDNSNPKIRNLSMTYVKGRVFNKNAIRSLSKGRRNPLSKYKSSLKESINSPEDGEELNDTPDISYLISIQASKTAPKRTGIIRKRETNKSKNTIKRSESGEKHINETAKSYGKEVSNKTSKASSDKTDKGNTRTNSRRRKVTFLPYKMKSEDKQKDRLVNKLSNSVNVIKTAAGGFLLLLLILSTVTIIPAAAVTAIIYNSPFAYFLPPPETGDTVNSVVSTYMSDFNNKIAALANTHAGYDAGEIIYVDFEGEDADNFNDIITVYMVKYGTGDTAAVMNEISKNRLKEVFDDMCSYSVSYGNRCMDNADGGEAIQTVLYVNVMLRDCYDMITFYGFSHDEIELAEEMLMMFGDSVKVTPQSALSQVEIDEVIQGITDSAQRTAVSFVLTKVGYPYSQQYRDSGSYYDCSSLAYYSWLEAGKDISYGGANTAAAEAEGLDRAGHTVKYEDMQPGDLIFYSYKSNGRYKNISHVAVYVGNGMAVEAKNARYGVTYNAVCNKESIVLIGRP